VRSKHALDPEVEAIRETLLKDKNLIDLVDYGAGSLINKGKKKSVKSIAKISSSPPKFSAFLHQVISYFGYQEVIELGTSLGLNSLYLSKDDKVNLTTFEGDPNLCKKARDSFSEAQRTNIHVVEGDINETLPAFLQTTERIDLAYLDANHKFEPTLNYFDLCLDKMSKNGLIILDDIHWSKEMWKAWKEIISRPEAILTVDLFDAGLVFLNPDIQPGNYTLTF